MSVKIKSILLVDDDPDSNRLYQGVIQDKFPIEQVHVAENGQQALDVLGSSDAEHLKPEIIFLDIGMPQMDGWAFLDAFDRLPEETREGIAIVLLSVSDDPADSDRAFAHKSVHLYIQKPLTGDEFAEVLKEEFPDL
jgi:CheY-like chemotaxis protein